MLPPGVNLPWLSYGGDFGANAWNTAGGLTARDLAPLHRTLAAARAAGAHVVRWFLLCDGRAGIVFDDEGLPLRLQEVVLDDLQAALDALHAHDLRMVPVLLDFTWGDRARTVDGVVLGGRLPVLRDPVARHRLWRVIDTVLLAFGRHPGIAMWDLFNEPEWLCAPTRPPQRRLSRRLLGQVLGELTLHARWHATQPITIGLASSRGLSLCRLLDLDVLQVHWYDHLERRAPLAHRPQVPWSAAPLLLGEFPSAGSRHAPATLISAAHDAGYAAAWPWSLLADDTSTRAEAALAALHVSRSLFDGR